MLPMRFDTPAGMPPASPKPAASPSPSIPPAGAQESSSAAAQPLKHTLEAQQLAHTLNRAVPSFATKVTTEEYQTLCQFIENAKGVPEVLEVKKILTYLHTMYGLLSTGHNIDPLRYLERIHLLSLFFDSYCQLLELKQKQLSNQKSLVAFPASKFHQAYQEEIHPAFTIFQRYMNFFFADLKKRGLLSNDKVKVPIPPTNSFVYYCLDGNGYVPVLSEEEHGISVAIVRTGEAAFKPPPYCNRKMLLFYGEEAETRAGFVMELCKEGCDLPGLANSPTLIIQGRYGVHDKFPFYIYGDSMVCPMKGDYAPARLFKQLIAPEIQQFLATGENRTLYVPFPDLTVEGTEFAYLYLEELMRAAQDPDKVIREEASAILQQIEYLEQKPVSQVMEELKKEILLSLETTPPAEAAKPPVSKTSTKPAATSVPKLSKKKQQQAQEEEIKANKARRLQEKFDEFMDKKRVKLRKATKLYNAVFQQHPELRVSRETSRGSHVSVATSEGVATAVRPHGGKDLSMGKRPVLNFIDKISKAVPGFGKGTP
ncbi:MAG: hypothetical protein LLG04_01410 [Parachlamydia sp.]|nr:hypothetical protein [Parachlamydia sp.]